MTQAPVPVPLTPIVREIIRGSQDQLTQGEIIHRLLGVGINLQPGELSSVLVKMLERKEVSRKRSFRVNGRGRRLVWAYTWRTEDVQEDRPGGGSDPADVRPVELRGDPGA
jgi:hypothetical protein